MYTPCTLSLIPKPPTRAIQSVDPKNPGIEPNMKWTSWPVAKIHLKCSNMTAGSSGNGRHHVTSSVTWPLDSPCGVSYRLWPCVCLARLWRYGVSKISGSRPWPFGGHVTSSVIRSFVCHSIYRPRIPYPGTKPEVDTMTGCRDMAIWRFPGSQVGQSSILYWCHTLHFATLRT